MFRYLQTKDEVESAGPTDHNCCRICQVGRVKTRFWNLKPFARHPLAVDPRNVIHAALQKTRQPNANATADVDDALRLQEIAENRCNSLRRGPCVMRTFGIVAICSG